MNRRSRIILWLEKLYRYRKLFWLRCKQGYCFVFLALRKSKNYFFTRKDPPPLFFVLTNFQKLSHYPKQFFFFFFTSNYNTSLQIGYIIKKYFFEISYTFASSNTLESYIDQNRTSISSTLERFALFSLITDGHPCGQKSLL